MITEVSYLTKIAILFYVKSWDEIVNKPNKTPLQKRKEAHER